MVEIKINATIENIEELKDMAKTISEIEEEHNCNCTLTTNVINPLDYQGLFSPEDCK